MAAQAQQQWGVTAPVSMAFPQPEELAMNDALLEELKAQNTFEATEETQRRVAVLNTLQSVTVKFVKTVGTLKGLPQNIVNEAGGRVFTFGSYRLGVFGPGSDIDTLVVAPRHVTRDDFFEHFAKLLEEASAPGAIEEITPVPDAHVPIMKLEYSGISIDLIFARIQLDKIPNDLDLKNNQLLRGLDDTDLRSVNGTRVTDEILSLVPQPKTFRHALRAVKLWAQRRAVYGNVMGFPGGVAWAMMVARICQLYPHATGAVVLAKFFNLMNSWRWPTPVLLKNMEEGPLEVRIWNPKIYPGDARHLMPIITPAYPSMCATHNITTSTKLIITRELERAAKICGEIMQKNRPWKDLFQKHTFFTDGYKYYLSIVSASQTKEAQQIWSGLVQSKVRRLVTGIEQSQAGVDVAHPYVKGFERVHNIKSEDEKDKVLQGSMQFISKEETETADKANDIKQSVVAQGNADNVEMPTNGTKQEDQGGATTIYTTTFYIGIELAKDAKSLDISWPVAEFKRQCTDWPQYNENLNSIRCVHIRSYDLPEDVFEAGEVKPAKKKKAKVAKSSAEPLSKKRTVDEANMDDSSAAQAAKRRQSGSHAGSNGVNGGTSAGVTT